MTNPAPTTTINGIEILPITESDALAIAELEAAAFQSHVITQTMFGASSPEKLDFRAVQLRALMAEAGDDSLSVKIVMEGKIVAFAHWSFRDEGWVGVEEEKEAEKKRKKAQQKKQNENENGAEDSDFPPEANVELCKEFFGWMHDARKRRMGGMAHCLLHLLVTHPDFQRRGLGSALMRQGLDIADERNLCSWLEASPDGYPLYKKFGFYDVELQQVDLKKYGSEGVADGFGMFRNSKDGSARPNDA